MRERQGAAAVYIRVSTENQLENYSVEEQSERLKAYCKAKDYNIYKIYTDGGYSGGNTERPALKQMLEDIHSSKIGIVVVYKLDRLSRSQKDTLTLIEDEFLSNNVEFVSVNENFDTSSPFGRAMIGILSVFAQLEKDQITERFTMGRIGRAKAGYYHGGSIIPTGYKYVNGKLIIDEYKALQVQEVFERFLSGYSVNSIQKHMDKKYGGWKSHTVVLNILRNNVYIGKVKFKKQAYDGLHKPIISTEIFGQAQTLLSSKEKERQKDTFQKPPFKAKYLLTGLIYCKRCGAKYSGVQEHYKCYSRSKCDTKYIIDRGCKNKNWEIELLDNVIVGEIKKLSLDEVYSNSLLLSKNDNPAFDLKAINERIKSIHSQTVRLLDLYQAGNIPIEDITQRIEVLQKEKEALNEKADSMAKCTKASENNFFRTSNVFENIFINGTLEEKRLLTNSIIKSVIVDGEHININWRI